jgi:hypothetical protein
MNKENAEREAQRIRDYWLALGAADIHVEVKPVRSYRTPTGHLVDVASIRSNLLNGLPPGFDSRCVRVPGMPRSVRP